MLSLAGSSYLPVLAVLYHCGRRSGRIYATPVGARPIRDSFLIHLTFGARADWFHNVQAAGECMVRWKGVQSTMSEPVVVDWPAVRSAFYPVERVFVPLIGIEQFVLLRFAP
jgi:deazaflavin-dependent oxidoreductase (nitroreductase family)